MSNMSVSPLERLVGDVNAVIGEREIYMTLTNTISPFRVVTGGQMWNGGKDYAFPQETTLDGRFGVVALAVDEPETDKAAGRGTLYAVVQKARETSRYGVYVTPKQANEIAEVALGNPGQYIVEV